ncbi:MAG: hypothetical protein MZV70_03270 [Desulfobacterales bacterium]|nr:hypothetical protein [Desulfobacterales bacterium]
MMFGIPAGPSGDDPGLLVLESSSRRRGPLAGFSVGGLNKRPAVFGHASDQ